MTDRELLEMAAKAAGIRLHVWGLKGKEHFCDIDKPSGSRRNPLTSDGDALRLAVKLGIALYPPECDSDDPTAHSDRAEGQPWITEPRGDDPYAATRRAIVRAAAEIGKATP